MNVVSTNHDPEYINLEDLQLETKPSYNWRDGSMRRQEEAIRTELYHMGIASGPWRDGERDSFGPLSREVTIELSKGNYRVVVYG